MLDCLSFPRLIVCTTFYPQKRTNQIELSDVTFARALPLSGDKITLKVHLDVALKVFAVEVCQSFFLRKSVVAFAVC